MAAVGMPCVVAVQDVILGMYTSAALAAELQQSIIIHQADAFLQVAVLVLSLQLRSALQGSSAVDLARSAAGNAGDAQQSSGHKAAGQQASAGVLLPGYQERRLPAAAPSDYILKVPLHSPALDKQQAAQAMLHSTPWACIVHSRQLQASSCCADTTCRNLDGAVYVVQYVVQYISYTQ